MVEGRVRVHGGDIAFLREGRGPPTILLHTIGGSAAEYTRLIPRLRDHLHVVAVDLPGHGHSYPLDEAEAVPDIAATLIELADHLGFKRFNVVGSSMSGTNAIETAIEHPERVHRIALISGTGPWADQPGLAPRALVPGDTSENKEISWFRSQFHDPSVADEPGFFDWWVASRSVADDEMIRAWRRRPLIDRALRECRAPLLLVIGEHDPLHPRAWAEAWASLLPDARVAEIENARHFLNLEAPEELGSLLVGFLG